VADEDNILAISRELDTDKAQTKVIRGLDGDKDKAVHAMEMTDGDQDAAQYAYGNYDLAHKAYRSRLSQHVVENDPMLQTYFNKNPMAPIVSKDDIHNLTKYNQSASKLGEILSDPMARMAAPIIVDEVESDPSGALAAGTRSALHATPATLAGAAAFPVGAETGAAVGAVGGPIGALVGGVIGGLGSAALAAYVTSKAEQKVTETFFPEEAERVKRDVEEHPIATVVGELATSAPLFGVGGLTKGSLLWRAAGATFMGGIEAAREEYAKGELDPYTMTGAIVGGALFVGKPTMFGEAVMAPGERLARAFTTGKFLTRYGRMGERPPGNANPVWDEFRAQDSKDAMDIYDEAFKDAQGSETRELSKDLFGNLTEQHSDADIALVREAVNKLYGDKRPEPGDGKLGDIPGISEQLELFRQLTGEDVTVGLKHWMNIDKEVEKVLHDDIRLRNDLYTLNEAKDVPKPEDAWDKAAPQQPTENEQVIADMRKSTGLGDPLIKEEPIPGPEPETVLFKSGVILPKRDYDSIVKEIKEIRDKDEAAAVERERKKAERRRKAEWSEEIAEMHSEVADHIDSKPDVKGWKFMSAGEVGGQLIGAKPKIDPTSMTPEQLTDFPKHWLSSGGLDVDQIGPLLGFKTGADFVEDMKAFRKAKGEEPFTQFRSRLIQAESMRRMEDRYGEFERLNAEEARDHVIGPKEEDLLWREYQVLADLSGQKIAFDRAAVKAMAAEDLAGRQHAKVSVIGVARELSKAARRTHDAWDKGDLLGAFQARQNVVHLTALANEAKKFETRKKADARILKQLWKREPTNMDPEFADWAHYLMLRHEIPVNRSQEHLDETLDRPEREFKTLDTWANSKNVPVDPNNSIAVGLPAGYLDFKTSYNPNFPIWEKLLDPSFDKLFDNMTVREYKGLTNAFRVLKKVGQDQSKGTLVINEKDVVAKDLAEKLQGGIERFGVIGQSAGPIKKLILSGYRRSLTWLENMDTFFGNLAAQDESGTWLTHILYPIEKADSAFMHDALKELAPRLEKALGAQDPRWHLKKVDNDTIMHEVHKTPLNLNNGSIVALYLVTGSRSAINHTAAGYNLKPDELIAYRDRVGTKEHYLMAKEIAKQFGWTQDIVDDMTMRRSGTILERDDPGIIQTPFSPSGGEPGWYYPRRQDTAIRPYMEAVDPHAQNINVALPHSFTIERTGKVYPVELHIDGLAQDLLQRLKYAHMQPIADIYNKVLRRPEIVQALQRHFGQERVDMLEQYFRDITGARGTRSNMETAINWLFGRLSGGSITDVIGFNIGTIEKHSPQSIAQSIADIGMRKFFKEVSRDMLGNNSYSEGVNRDFIHKGAIIGGREWKGVKALQTRRRNYQEDPEEISRLMRGQMLPGEAGAKAFAQLGASTLGFVDQQMSELTWMARYRQRNAENFARLTEGKQLTPEQLKDAEWEAHDLAESQANRMVRMTHGSPSIVGKAEWLRSQNAMVKAGAQAMNFFNNALNRRFRSIYMIQDLVHGRSPRPVMEDVRTIAKDIFTYVFLPTLIEDTVEPLCKVEDSAAACGAKFVGQGLAAPIPLFRDLVHGMLSETTPTYGTYTNLFRFGVNAARSGKRYLVDDDESKLGDVVENVMGLTGGLLSIPYGTGVPLAAPGRIANWAIKYNQGSEDLPEDWKELHRLIRHGKTRAPKHEEERIRLIERLFE
jgi:hypothetical protein